VPPSRCRRPSGHFLVLDAAPEALKEDVVAPRASAVHADRDLVSDERVGGGARGELAAPVDVEDLRRAVTCRRLLQCFNAEHRWGGRRRRRERL
jgi:hypothetical protein